MTRAQEVERRAQALANAVQRFRNLPGLKDSPLRRESAYGAMCDAWDAFVEMTGDRLVLGTAPVEPEPPVDGGRALVAAILMQPMVAAVWRPRRDRPEDIADNALEFADALLEAIRGGVHG